MTARARSHQRKVSQKIFTKGSVRRIRAVLIGNAYRPIIERIVGLVFLWNHKIGVVYTRS